MIFRFGSYTLDIDVDRTRAFYTREDVETTSEKCVCQGCQNYDKAIFTASDAVVGFLRSLGIDPRKPAEIYSVKGELEEDGTLWYNGWLHVCGVLLECPKTTCKTMGKHEFYAYETNVEYFPDPDYPFSVLPVKNLAVVAKNFPTPVLQLEIDAHLPWVLPVSYED